MIANTQNKNIQLNSKATYVDLKVLAIYKYFLMLVFLESMHAWFLWDTKTYFVLISVFFTMFLVFSTKNFFCLTKSNLQAVAIYLIISVYLVRGSNVNGLIFGLLSAFCISSVILLQDKYKIELFQLFTKVFAILLVVSMIAWLLFIVGVPLPYKFSSFNDGQYNFQNYYFFLMDVRFLNFTIIPRFSSVFLEPGHLGLTASFLLFANNFNLKNKFVLVIFIANILTFSLAAYVLMLLSLIIKAITLSKNPIKGLIITGVSIILLSSFFQYYNQGDNLVNNTIIQRLKIVDGDLAGNNRFTEHMDTYFSDLLKTNKKYLGIGNKKYQTMSFGPNAGYKVFIVQHGIIGTLLVFLLYLAVVRKRKTISAWAFLLLYILSFLQRAYALWDVQLLIFITGVTYLAYTQKNKTAYE